MDLQFKTPCTFAISQKILLLAQRFSHQKIMTDKLKLLHNTVTRNAILGGVAFLNFTELAQLTKKNIVKKKINIRVCKIYLLKNKR